MPPLPRPPPSYANSMRTWCLPGGIGRVPSSVVALEAEEVVAVLRLAVLDVEAPAADDAALGDDDALGARSWHDHLGGDGMRRVLHDHDRVLGQPAHAAEEELPRCP